jgi:hypothetical protein
LFALIIVSIASWTCAEYVWEPSWIGFFQSLGVWLLVFPIFIMIYCTLDYRISKMFFPKRVVGLEGNAQALSLAGPVVSVGVAVLFYLKQTIVSVFFN